jgi:hypothetical protein
MPKSREPFVEPEIVRHEEKVADVTTSVSPGTVEDDAPDLVN